MATVQEMREAGFSDEEIGQWAEQKRATLSQAGFDDHEISNYLTGIDLPKKVPQALMDRVEQGSVLSQVTNKIGTAILDRMPFVNFEKGLLKGASGGEPEKAAGILDALQNVPEDAGWFVGKQLKGIYESMVEAPGQAQRIGEHLASTEDIVNFAGNALWGAGPVSKLPGGFVKLEKGLLGEVKPVEVGGLPDQMNFVDASTAVGDGQALPHVEQKLLQAYEDKGLHPAEVAHDAAVDPTVKQEMLSVNPGLPEKYVGKYTEPEQEVIVPDTQAGAGGQGPPRIEGPVIDAEEAPRRIEGPEKVEPNLEEATQTILDHISIGEREPRRGWSLSRLYTDVVDSMNPIKQLERELGPVPADESPYAAYRMLTGSPTQAHDMVMGSGVPDFKQLYKPGARPEDVGTTAPSLKEILEPVSAAGDLDKFRAFAAAARTIELERRGIETGFDLDAARVVAKGYADQYAETLARMIDFQNKVSQSLVDSGILSAKARQAMLQHNLIYTPFYRVLEPEEARVGTGTLMPSNPVKNIIGSERQIIDPLESIIKNTYLYTSMANRNLAARTLADYMEKAGLAPIVERGMFPATAPEHVADLSAWIEHYGVPKATADEFSVAIQTAASQDLPEGRIAVFRNGRRDLHEVDPEIARAIRGLDRTTASTLVKMLGQWTSMLRAGSTLVPEFAGRHIMRDFLYAFVTSPGGFSPLNMVRGIVHHIKEDQVYRDWVRSGAANVTMQAFDRRWLQEDVRQLTADAGLMTRAWNVVASPELSVGQKAGIGFRAALHPLQVITEIAQSASHLGAFEKALKRGVSMREAAWESRETAVDISRRGARMQAYNMLSAFANATIQDTDRWMRELSPRDPKKAAGAAFKIMAGITIPSIMLWMNNHNDPDYKELHDWEKDLFWLVPLGSGPPSIAHQQTPGWENKNSAWAWARVPKPWGMGLLFGSGVERALDAIVAQKPDAFKNFFSSIAEMNVPGMVPSAITPVLEQWADKSVFTGRPLIPKSLESQLPEYQYTNYTTQTAQSIGHLIGAFKSGGVSPIVLENYLQGWTGRLGDYVLQLTDYGLREAGIVPDLPKPLSTLADMPVVRAFVARYPSASTQSLEDFHEEYQKRAMIYQTYMKQTQEGNEEAAKKLLAMGGQEMFVRLQGMNLAIAKMNNAANMIYKNPQMSAGDKRQLIDKLYGDMTEIAKAGNKVFRETKVH